MSHYDVRSAVRPQPDQPMVDIADYVIDYRVDSQEAYDTARYMLLDSLACAMLAMKFPDCVKHLGPLVPGAVLPGGALVPGTSAPPGRIAPGTIGPRCLTQSGNFIASIAQASESSSM